MYGYGSVDKEQYQKNVAKVHPGNNKFGVHPGTGLVGLAGMYCNNDTERMKKAFGQSLIYVNNFIDEVGMKAVYADIADYLYDCSQDSLLNVEQMIRFKEYNQNRDYNEAGEDIDSGIIMGGYADDKINNAGTMDDTTGYVGSNIEGFNEPINAEAYTNDTNAQADLTRATLDSKIDADLAKEIDALNAWNNSMSNDTTEEVSTVEDGIVDDSDGINSERAEQGNIKVST